MPIFSETETQVVSFEIAKGNKFEQVSILAHTLVPANMFGITFSDIPSFEKISQRAHANDLYIQTSDMREAYFNQISSILGISIKKLEKLEETFYEEVLESINSGKRIALNFPDLVFSTLVKIPITFEDGRAIATTSIYSGNAVFTPKNEQLKLGLFQIYKKNNTLNYFFPVLGNVADRGGQCCLGASIIETTFSEYFRTQKMLVRTKQQEKIQIPIKSIIESINDEVDNFFTYAWNNDLCSSFYRRMHLLEILLTCPFGLYILTQMGLSILPFENRFNWNAQYYHSFALNSSPDCSKTIEVV